MKQQINEAARMQELAGVHNENPASNLLSLLASPEMKTYMNQLLDTLGNDKFMRVKKLYDGLYAELKKYE